MNECMHVRACPHIQSLAPSTALECIVGLFFCMLGVLNLAGELKPITASASEQYESPLPPSLSHIT